MELFLRKCFIMEHLKGTQKQKEHSVVVFLPIALFLFLNSMVDSGSKYDPYVAIGRYVP